MTYVGLVPSEESSGGMRRQGSITKVGYSRVRHVVPQSPGATASRIGNGPVLERRQEGQPPDAVVQSWKAQHGLHQMFKRLALKKNSQIGAVTMAREPVGFAWAPPEQA